MRFHFATTPVWVRVLTVVVVFSGFLSIPSYAEEGLTLAGAVKEIGDLSIDEDMAKIVSITDRVKLSEVTGQPAQLVKLSQSDRAEVQLLVAYVIFRAKYNQDDAEADTHLLVDKALLNTLRSGNRVIVEPALSALAMRRQDDTMDREAWRHLSPLLKKYVASNESTAEMVAGVMGYVESPTQEMLDEILALARQKEEELGHVPPSLIIAACRLRLESFSSGFYFLIERQFEAVQGKDDPGLLSNLVHNVAYLGPRGAPFSLELAKVAIDEEHQTDIRLIALSTLGRTSSGTSFLATIASRVLDSEAKALWPQAVSIMGQSGVDNIQAHREQLKQLRRSSQTPPRVRKLIQQLADAWDQRGMP